MDREVKKNSQEFWNLLKKELSIQRFSDLPFDFVLVSPTGPYVYPLYNITAIARRTYGPVFYTILSGFFSSLSPKEIKSAIAKTKKTIESIKFDEVILIFKPEYLTYLDNLVEVYSPYFEGLLGQLNYNEILEKNTLEVSLPDELLEDPQAKAILLLPIFQLKSNAVVEVLSYSPSRNLVQKHGVFSFVINQLLEEMLKDG